MIRRVKRGLPENNKSPRKGRVRGATGLPARDIANTDAPLDLDSFFHDGHGAAAAIAAERYRVYDIVDGAFEIGPPLDMCPPDLVPAMMETIRSAARAVGRIEPVSGASGYSGTGFVVGPNLIATNRHVAAAIAEGLGRTGLSMRTRQRINFRRERDVAVQLPCRIKRPVLIHPYWDFALFETEPLPADIVPLRLATDEALAAPGRVVAVIGYPWEPDDDSSPSLRKEIFGEVYGVKRLQPGELEPLTDHAEAGVTTKSLDHSASTSGGNSGSPVIDVESGLVVGIHFGGVFNKSNWSIPTCLLCRDPRVGGYPGLNLDGVPASDPEGPWKPFWAALNEPDEV